MRRNSTEIERCVLHHDRACACRPRSCCARSAWCRRPHNATKFDGNRTTIYLAKHFSRLNTEEAMTEAHDPMVVGAGNGRAPLRAAHTSEEDRRFLHTVVEFNRAYHVLSRTPLVAKKELSLKALFEAVQDCEVCSCSSACAVLRTALNEFVRTGLSPRGDAKGMGAYCVCTWLRRRTPLDPVFDQVRNGVEKHARM